MLCSGRHRLPILSFALCAGSIVVWIGSYFFCCTVKRFSFTTHQDTRQWAYTRNIDYWISLSRGRLWFSRERQDSGTLDPPDRVEWHTQMGRPYKFYSERDVPDMGLNYSFAGLNVYYSESPKEPGTPSKIHVLMPVWLICSILAILPLTQILRFRRDPKGGCHLCGYDLRAT